MVNIPAMTPKGRARDKHERVVKTTVELPEDLWRAAKIKAMDERTDLRSVLIRALQAYLKGKLQKGGA
jgi:hypothetical protein